MARLKEVREAIESKNQRLDDIEASCSKEARSWNDEEKKEIKNINDEIDSFIEERNMLEKEEKRKAERAKELIARKADEDKKTEDKEKEERGSTIEVTAGNLKTKEARNAKVFSMLQAYVSNDYDKLSESRKSLFEGGHFGEHRSFNTLTDTKGGILVPSIISSEIMDIEQSYGFIPQFANNLGDIGQSEITVPNILGRPTFTAVNQASAISGSGLNLGGITLKPLKWGAIIDWTNEVDESVGARLLPIVQNKIAEALAYVKDDTFINGNGQSTYNNIKGLTTLVGAVNYVRQATAAGGHVSFDTITADDFLLPIENVTPGKRAGSVFLMHPNLVLKLKKIKDGQGMYIYGMPSEQSPVGTLFGYPVITSEAFPFTDGTSETVCAFVNPSSIGYANGRNLRADVLREATITNEDGSSINLGTTDAQALRWTAIFDMKLDNNTRSTASTAQGAFSVLRTAAS